MNYQLFSPPCRFPLVDHRLFRILHHNLKFTYIITDSSRCKLDNFENSSPGRPRYGVLFDVKFAARSTSKKGVKTRKFGPLLHRMKYTQSNSAFGEGVKKLINYCQVRSEGPDTHK